MANDLSPLIHAHHQEVDKFLTAAHNVPTSQWSQPRAPGKWSPGQVVEHLALAYETNRGVLHGRAPMTAPRLIRPLIRTLGLKPVLRRGRFIPGSKSPKIFRPGPVPAPPSQLLQRLAAAAASFEADAAALNSETIDHPFFGRLSLGDFVRLQEIHTRHHRGQLSPASVSS
jgi:DinB family protein